MRSFVHKVLRCLHTSGVVLQTVLCYLEAIWLKVPDNSCFYILHTWDQVKGNFCSLSVLSHMISTCIHTVWSAQHRNPTCPSLMHHYITRRYFSWRKKKLDFEKRWTWEAKLSKPMSVTPPWILMAKYLKHFLTQAHTVPSGRLWPMKCFGSSWFSGNTLTVWTSIASREGSHHNKKNKNAVVVLPGPLTEPSIL